MRVEEQLKYICCLPILKKNLDGSFSNLNLNLNVLEIKRCMNLRDSEILILFFYEIESR